MHKDIKIACNNSLLYNITTNLLNDFLKRKFNRLVFFWGLCKCLERPFLNGEDVYAKYLSIAFGIRSGIAGNLALELNHKRHP
jgi:hypothetical protein